MTFDESFFNQVSESFSLESTKLKELISDFPETGELTIEKIIPLYYQILNVSSMSTMLKQQLDQTKHKTLLEKIKETGNFISEKFDTQMHPDIVMRLTKSIQETTNHLQSEGSEQKSKDEIENQAQLYEELRKKLSTKEFVLQYDQGLSDD